MTGVQNAGVSPWGPGPCRAESTSSGILVSGRSPERPPCQVCRAPHVNGVGREVSWAGSEPTQALWPAGRGWERLGLALPLLLECSRNELVLHCSLRPGVPNRFAFPAPWPLSEFSCFQSLWVCSVRRSRRIQSVPSREDWKPLTAF